MLLSPVCVYILPVILLTDCLCAQSIWAPIHSNKLLQLSG